MWSTRVMDRFFVYSAPAVEDGKLYICGSGGGGDIFCFNATTGEQIWKFDWNTAADISSPAVVDGRVYAHADGSTRCLNASTGEQIWAYFMEANSLSSPTVADGRVYVGAGAKIVCLNASTGELLWEHEVVGQYSDSSSAVAYGRVYVGFYDHNVYCLNASTGELLWKYTTGGDITICSPAIASCKVYITSTYPDYKLYCLNAFTGDFIWAYRLGVDWIYKLSPAVAYGKLYSGSGDGKVYCFGGHDVAVVDTSPSSTEAYAGDTINVTVTARNEGTFNETFNVRAYYDSTSIGTQTVTDLPQDEDKSLTFSWNTTAVPGGYYTISANATIVPGETHTADNNFIDGTVKITSPVWIVEVVPCDLFGYPKGTFQHEALAFFKVALNSTALIPQNTLITVNLHDELSFPIGIASFQAPIMSGISTIIFCLPLSRWAFSGTATVYACAFTDWPSQGGFPHCPGMSATFEIIGP
jgi:outer membrane protein assembly factor BamB